MSRKLTSKQRAFIDQYLIDMNASAAYVRAGFRSRGHSAEVNAARLMKHPAVAAAIAEAMERRSQRTMIGADNVLRELARVAFFDIGNAFTADGALKPLDEMNEDTRRALAGIEINEIHDADGIVVGYTKKIRISDKLKALELLGKHLGLFDERIKISGDEQNPLVLLIKHVQGATFKPVAQPNHIDNEQFSKH